MLPATAACTAVLAAPAAPAALRACILQVTDDTDTGADEMPELEQGTEDAEDSEELHSDDDQPLGQKKNPELQRGALADAPDRFQHTAHVHKRKNHTTRLVCASSAAAGDRQHAMKQQ